MKKRIIDLKTKLDSFGQRGRWQNVMRNIITSDLLWLLIACGVFRFIYYYCFLNTDWFPDSITYLNYTANILLGQVDVMRTPVYPYFIKLIKLFGAEQLIQNIIFAQSIISFLTIIVFYKTICIIFKNRAVIIMASLIYGIMPTIINFDKCILTESLSISAIVIFLYFIVSYFKKRTILKASLFTLYVFFLVMLRPSFIFLLPLIIIFWVIRMMFYRKDWKMCLSGLAASFVCILLIWGYIQLNYMNNGFRGIALPSNINQLDNIINANMYEYGNDSEISETIKQNLSKSQRQYNDSVKNILYMKYSLERISRFSNNCIKNQPSIFLKYTIVKTINLSQSKATTYYARVRGGLLSELVIAFSNIFSITFLFIYLLLFFDVIYIIVMWVKLKQAPWFKIILESIIIGQLAIAIIGAQGEYQRLSVSVLPYFIVLLFSYFDMLLYSTDKDKLSKYLTSGFDKHNTFSNGKGKKHGW